MIARAPGVRRGAILLSATLSLSACGLLPATPQSDALLQSVGPGPRHWEQTDLPIVLQEPDYCGPAALSMVLGQAGITVDQQTLADKVFLPGRSGTLQTEMLAGPRHFGALAYELNGQLTSLLDEVRAGHSPVVLLNLGLDWAPRWHYAVVMGFDLDQGDIVLRSGTLARQAMPLRTFEHTWRRARYWSMVVMRPGAMPLAVTPDAAERAALGFAQTAPAKSQLPVWSTLVQRWPDRLLGYLAWGNALRDIGQHEEAAQRFEAAAQRFNSAVAWNNLAQAHLSLGRPTAAREAALHALSAAKAHEPRWLPAIEDTLHIINQAQPPCAHPSPGC